VNRPGDLQTRTGFRRGRCRRFWFWFRCGGGGCLGGQQLCDMAIRRLRAIKLACRAQQCHRHAPIDRLYLEGKFSSTTAQKFYLHCLSWLLLLFPASPGRTSKAGAFQFLRTSGKRIHPTHLGLKNNSEIDPLPEPAISLHPTAPRSPYFKVSCKKPAISSTNGLNQGLLPQQPCLPPCTMTNRFGTFNPSNCLRNST